MKTARVALAVALVLGAALAAAGARSAAAQERTLAFTGAEVRPVSGPPIADAVLLVRGGKVVALGPAGRVEIPADAEVRDHRGHVIIPGLVDTHSHIGLYPRPRVPAHEDGNELSGPLQGALRALDAVWPDDPGIAMARAGGITTANIMPGSANPVGGQTVYVKLRGRTADAMVVRSEGVGGGLKMANGENPKRASRKGQAPKTRMAVAALQRKAFLRARAYREKWQRYRDEGDDAEPPERNLELEPLVEVLAGERTVHFHCHRADDILTALRLRDEFGFDLVLQHVSEGHKVAAELARREVPVSLLVVDSPGGKHETAELVLETAGVLERAGVRVALHTDDPVTPSRLFLRVGGLAVRGGMSEAGALRAMTLEGARMLGLDARLGSLEPGKDADFAVLSGAPFSVWTQVLETWIDGVRHFDRADPRDRAYAVGGFGLDGRRIGELAP